ncbi:Pycsar system effector family protein [Pseudoalteromonas sp. T1lg24]|uniref:Pycsar system effector family protein n=1 Tax=Pseudoalteromonas sp. T1lg24 TaxID=2077099 RepID=UPI00131A32E0|nr:Pycsar system effector family protein [Pseudoalteromonas sp. T1lg24]
MSDSDNLINKSAFLFDVLKRYDHYVATTNFKVGLMMSFIGAIILGLTIRVMSLVPEAGSCNYLYYSAIIFSILTITFSLCSAINLLRVVFPNTTTSSDYKSLIFFGDVKNTENGADGYIKKIEEVTSADLLKDLSKQTYVVAGIIDGKFRLLKTSVRMISYGVIPLLAISLLLLILEGVI